MLSNALRQNFDGTQSNTVKFPETKNESKITLTPDELQKLIASAVQSALEGTANVNKPKSKSHKQMKTTSPYKTNGVKKATAAEPLRNAEQFNDLCDYMLTHGKEDLRVRNYVLIQLGCTLGLRISDLLTLTTDMVFTSMGDPMQHVDLIEKKTGKKVRVVITSAGQKALEMWYTEYMDKTVDYPSVPIFFSHKDETSPMTGIQAWRIINGAAKAIGLEGNYGTHTLRKTFGYNAYEAAKNCGDAENTLELLQAKFNHSDQRITMRYACITNDKIDKMAEAAAARMKGEE